MIAPDGTALLRFPGKKNFRRMLACRWSVGHVSRPTRNSDFLRPADTPVHRFRYAVPMGRNPVDRRRANPRHAHDFRYAHRPPAFHSNSDHWANRPICNLLSIVMHQECPSNCDAPAYSEPVQPLADLCLSRFLHDTRSDGPPLLAQIVISHPAPVCPEAVQHPRQIIPVHLASRATSQTADGHAHPVGPVRIIPQYILPLPVFPRGETAYSDPTPRRVVA